MFYAILLYRSHRVKVKQLSISVTASRKAKYADHVLSYNRCLLLISLH